MYCVSCISFSLEDAGTDSYPPLDLLHDVSSRSNYNRMDATNLAIVICPNLVKGANPMRDVMMCTVPVPGSTPTQLRQTQNRSDDGSGRTTLGMVIALCIRRYYEIFDEAIDRTEAVAPWRSLKAQGTEDSTTQDMYVLADGDDDDDLEDEMPAVQDPNSAQITTATYRHANNRHRNTISNASSKVTSKQSLNNDNASPYLRARSVISIENSRMNNGKGNIGTVGKATISLGRGTTRKGSGAAVEAVSVMAEGFFSDPSAPPLPPRKNATSESINPNPKPSDMKEPRLSISERRQLFESGI